MISQELLNILVCPETKQPLHLIDDELLRKINKAIQQGKVVNRDGDPVTENLDGGLIREDKKIVYPIIGDLPYLRIGDGIELEKNHINV